MTETEEKSLDQLLQTICANGVNGLTGAYSLPPMSNTALATMIAAESDPANLNELQFKKNRPVDSPVSEAVQDPTDLSQAGWAVVFPAAMDNKRREAIEEALKPLLDHRQEKAGGLYKPYRGDAGYRTNESKQDFFKRQTPEIKRGPARPEQMPFYVLLVGSPEEIPYEFQFQLDVMRGVGRLDFGDDLQAYAHYAQNVVAAETGGVALPRKATFFSVRNPGDDATLLSDRYMVPALFANLQQPNLQYEIPLKFPWDLSRAPSGEKAELARLLGGANQTPALLFTASHGIDLPSAPLPQRLSEQGALLCQRWVKDGPVFRDDYFAADDLGNVNLLGLVAMFFACFGLGTPQYDYYTDPKAAARTQIAPYSFTSALPQRMLRQGALAVIGHVDRAWGYSFVSPGGNVEIEAFVLALRKLLNGDPIGLATDPSFNMKYADMTTTLTQELENVRYNPDYLSNEELVKQLVWLWTSNNDARSYAVLGDPAVRIPFAQDVDATGERPSAATLPATVLERLTALQAEIAPASAVGYTVKAEGIAPVGDIKVEAEHLEAVNKDFAVQINQITQSLQQFGSKIAEAIRNITQDILTLEVRTYATEDLKDITLNTANAPDLRALTIVNFDGDMRNYVPTTASGVDEELWQIHREMVREAQANRTQFVSAMAKMASDLLDTIK